jgi:signal transduction histidine kinase/DNA-binding response OmpR family regulator
MDGVGAARVRQSLQKKIIAIFLCLGIGLIMGTYVVLKMSVFPAFNAIERQLAAESLSRVNQAITSELDTLLMFSREYGAWDETYRYVQDPEAFPEFIEDNMYDDYWVQVNVHSMMIFNVEDQYIWGTLLDPKFGKSSSLESDPLPDLAGSQILLQHNTIRSEKRGLIETPMGIILAVSVPILHSDDTGPIMGSVLAGRFLTDDLMAQLARKANVRVDLYRISDTKLPAHIQTAPQELADTDVKFVTGIQEDHVYTHSLLRDLSGQPIAVLETRTPRHISAAGAETITTALRFVSLAVILFISAAWLLLRFVVVRPISTLEAHMKRLRHTGDLSMRFASKRQDEIGSLALEFDKLTSDLNETQQNLQLSRDEAEASSQAKSIFLANMSHEIRTPMNGVVGMTEVLLATSLTEQQRYLATTIGTSGQVLLNVINNILDFSKISAGKMELDPKSFQLDQLTIDINAIMATSAQRKGLEYICHIDHDLPASVEADSQRIIQVLINLVGNAIKFTQAGQVSLSVKCARTPLDESGHDAILSFSVKDSGIGIPPDAQSLIFQSFSQSDSSTTRKYGGTGLGLTISKELVEAMGGELSVHSALHEGAEFSFTVPVTIVDDTQLEAPQSLVGLKVLAVVGNESSRAVLGDHLEYAKANWEAVGTAAAAVKKLDKATASVDRYELLLIDAHLSDADSLQFSEDLHDEVAYGRPRVIMLNAATDELTHDKLSAAGITDLIPKPVIAGELYRILCAAVAAETLEIDPSVETREADSKLCANLEILVVEDNRVNQELIVMLLQQLGARVTAADNGQEALGELAKHYFDLVIMDCQMPVMDGYEASRQIRKKNLCASNRSPMPILAMTANVHDQEACFKAGMNAYISKPYKYHELLAALKPLLPVSDVEPSEPTPPADAAESGLDLEMLNQLKDFQGEKGSDLLDRLIEIYLETSPALLDDLNTAVTKKNAAAIQLHAHSLKSNSARLGGTYLAALCYEMEEMGRTQNLDDRNRLLQILKEEFAIVAVALIEQRTLG